MDKKDFERFAGLGFIKSSDSPAGELPGEAKARLNRKGNEFYNQGDLERARRIYQTTGYSDGLIRVGDKYLSSGRPVDALKMYYLAHDEGRVGELAARAALAIQKLLREEDSDGRASQPGRA